MLQILSTDDVDRIHSAALELLARTGVRVEGEEARAILHGAGCTVQDDRVYLPSYVVELALERTPDAFVLAGRDPAHQIHMAPDGPPVFRPGGGIPNLWDLDSGSIRHPTRSDCGALARIMDALEGVDLVGGLVAPRDVAPAMTYPVILAETLANTTKAVASGGGDNPAQVRVLVQMAAAVRGSLEALRQQPLCVFSLSPISPLYYSADAAGAVVEIARLGMPLGLLPAPILGTTGPITLAGSLAQQHAEILAGLVLAQAVRPGLPFLYYSRISVTDMRTGMSLWGNPEIGVTGACAVQLARRCRLPSNVYGLSTNAKAPDLDAGFEKALNALLPALAGATVLSGVGSLDNGVLAAFEQLAVDDEIIGLVRYMLRPVSVDDEHLATGLVASVVAGSRHFLAERHTLRHLRAGELARRHLADTTRLAEWQAAGQPSMRDRARDRVRELLAVHNVEPLRDEVGHEITAILAEAERQLA